MGAILSVSDYEKKKAAYIETMTKVEKYEILARENKALGKAIEDTLLTYVNQLEDPIEKQEELKLIKEIKQRVRDVGEKEAVKEIQKTISSPSTEEETSSTKDEPEEEETSSVVESEEPEEETSSVIDEPEETKIEPETKSKPKERLYKPSLFSKEIELDDTQFALKQEWTKTVQEKDEIKKEKNKLEQDQKINKEILAQKRQKLKDLINTETNGEMKRQLELLTSSISRSEEDLRQTATQLTTLESSLMTELAKENTDKKETNRILKEIEQKTKELSNGKKSLIKLLEMRKEVSTKDTKFAKRFSKLDDDIKDRISINEALEEKLRLNEIKGRMNEIDIQLAKTKFLLSIEKDEVKKDSLEDTISELEDDKTDLESLYSLEPVEEETPEPEPESPLPPGPPEPEPDESPLPPGPPGPEDSPAPPGPSSEIEEAAADFAGGKRSYNRMKKILNKENKYKSFKYL